MSSSDNGPDDRKERYRRAMAFLDGARHLSDLTPSQIDRIERHLNRARPLRARRSILAPALATLAVVLLAGAALAVTGRGLVRVPGIGPLVAALFTPAPAPARRAPTSGQPRHDEPAEKIRTPPPERPPAVPAATASAARAATTPGTEISTSAPAQPRSRRSETTLALAAASRGREPTGVAADVRKPVVAESAPRLAPPATTTAATTSPPPATPGATSPPAAPVPAAAEVPAPAPAVPSQIVAESRSFAAALGRWNRNHDAHAALAALDAHERRFPDGEIRLEAQLLRAEILLAGGREREGLALLDPLPLAGLPRARELRTVRGELRVKLGRCPEGKTDLDTVLAEGAADALAQRARQALSACP